MNLKNDEYGGIAIFFVAMLPVLIGFIGISIDGGHMLLKKAQLDAATEAAGRSCVLLSYDKEIWDSEGRVVIDQYTAEEQSKEMLQKNFDEAELVDIELLEENKFRIETKVKVEFCFMKIFGFKDKEISCSQIYFGG